MRLFFPISFLVTLSLCLQLVVPNFSSADILLTVENPTQDQSISGISLISGWTFSQTENAQVTVRYQIDNLASGEIPCCVDRTDVAQANLQYPQALRSGFGLLVNFNLLADGLHTLTIEVEDDSGSPTQSQTLTFSTARPGNFQFLSDLDLAPSSTDDIEWDSAHQSFLIKGAVAVEKETEKQQEVNILMAWQSNTQTLSVIQSENVGEPSGGAEDTDQDGFFPSSDCNDDNAAVYPGAQEICDDGIDNNCNGLIDDSDPACGGSSGTPQPILLTLENPSSNPTDLSTRTLGGIGAISGWAVATTPDAHINSVRLRVDGDVVGDLPCCTNRLDVQNALPNIPQALESGFGALTNFNLLSSGLHTFSVEAQDSAGNTQKIDQPATTAKLGDSEFLDKFDLANATATLDGDFLTVEDINIRDKATQQESTITASYLWEPSCQCFVVQQTCGNGTTNEGEECDGLDLEGETCASFGFSGGTLACRPRCAASDDDCFLPCVFEIKDCQGRPSIYVTNTNSNNVSVIDPITNEVTAKIKVGAEPRGIAVSPDGSTVYVTNFQDDTLSIIQRATNTVTDTIDVGNGPIGLAVAPDSARVYVVNGLGGDVISNGTISVIEAASKTVAATIPVGKQPQAIALTPDGDRAYITNYEDSSVSVLDLKTHTALNPIFVGHGPDGIAVAPDGEKVYVVNYGFEDDENQGTVSVINVATGKVTDTITVGFRPTKIAISPDSKRAFVSNSIDETVSIINLETLIISGIIPTTTNSESNPDGVALLPGGQRLYVALFGRSFGSRVQVFSTLTPTIFAEITVGDGPFAIAVAPAF